MIRSLTFVTLLSAAALAGCTDRATWYEQRCLNYGLKSGTADFDACVARDKAWLDQERARANQPGGQN